MKYTKPALSFEQQAQRLIDRGLVIQEKTELIRQLSGVNYYRLSAYWYPFKQIDPTNGEERFSPNTTFETIWRRYIFDRQLRLLIMDAVSGWKLLFCVLAWWNNSPCYTAHLVIVT